VAIAARRAEGYREKGAQFVVRAPVRFIRSAGHWRCWRELTWLASDGDQGWAMRRII